MFGGHISGIRTRSLNLDAERLKSEGNLNVNSPGCSRVKPGLYPGYAIELEPTPNGVELLRISRFISSTTIVVRFARVIHIESIPDSTLQ